MHLIQLFLPVYGQAGTAFPNEHFTSVQKLLTEQFGGVTAYARAPARGFWKDQDKVKADDIIVFEVMVDDLDRDWWQGYRKTLEARFQQDELLVRVQSVEVL